MSGVLQPIRRMPPHYRGIRRYRLVNEADGLALGPLSLLLSSAASPRISARSITAHPHPQRGIGTACRTGARTTSASALARNDVIFRAGGRSASGLIRASLALR